LLEKNLKLYELANKEASIIYEKQNKVNKNIYLSTNFKCVFEDNYIY